jgi:4-hydroxy-L-threonine phosphate dehydrogenase PdxA
MLRQKSIDQFHDAGGANRAIVVLGLFRHAGQGGHGGRGYYEVLEP